MTTATHEIVRVGGYVIFGFIMLPVYLMILGWLFGRPRDYRTVAITVGYAVTILLAIVLGLAFLDVAISFIKAT